MGKYSSKSTVGWSPGVTPGQYSLTSADAAAVASAAHQLGITPGQLMGIIANETSYKGNPDTFNPGIFGGGDYVSDADTTGEFFGLFQASPDVVAKFGIDTVNPTYQNQMQALVAYALAEGFVPGEMDAGNLYNAILSGNPLGSLNNKSAGVKVSSILGTAADKAAKYDGYISALLSNPQLSAMATAVDAANGNISPVSDAVSALADAANSGFAFGGLANALLGDAANNGAYAISADTAPASSEAISNGISGLYSAQTAYAPTANMTSVLSPSGNAPYGAEGIVAAALAGDKSALSAALATVAQNAANSLSLGQKIGMLADSGKKSAFEAKVTSDVASYLNGQDAAVLGQIAQNVKSDPGLLSALPAAMQTQVATTLSAYVPNFSASSSEAAAKNAEGTAKALAALSSPTPTNAGISKGMSGLASAGAYGISPGSIGSGMSGLASAGAGYASSPSSPASVSAGMSGLASAGAGPSPSSVSAGMSGLASAGKSTSAPSSSPSISSGMSGLASAGAPTSLGPVSYSTPTTGSSASSAQGAQAMSSPAAMAALSGLTGNNGITTATPTTMASLSQAATTLGDVGDLTGFIAPAAVVAPAAKTTTAKAVPAAKSKTSTTVAAKTKTPAQSLYGQAVANSVANGYGTPASFGPGTMYGVSPSGQPYSSIGNAYGGTTTSWGTSGGGTATAVGYASQRGGDQGQAVPAAVASGSSAGAKVLCTHYKDKGWLPRDIWVADIRYSLMAPMDMRIGYLSWAMPLVDYLKTGTRTARIAERILWPVVRAWSQEMAHRGDPRFEGSFWGRIVLHTFGSVCLVIGRNIRRKWIGETVNG